jgi:hypothetical protein
MVCLLMEVKGSQKRNGYRNETDTPQRPVGLAPDGVLGNCMGACTQIFVLALPLHATGLPPLHENTEGRGAGYWAREGLSLEASKSLWTAATALVAKVAGVLQVAQ